MNEQAALAALLRSDLGSFIWKSFQTILPGTPYLPNWHIDAIVRQLMRVHGSEISRLLINQPPRSLKSICVSVAYVAWLLGHDPTRRVIVVSYSNEFAAELHRQFRMVIDAPWYRALFPGMRPARDTGTELVTTAGGSRYATSVGGALTGRGADLIIVDDPLKAEEAMSEAARKRVIDWYGGTLVSRLNDKETGPIVVVMQRLHENDLAGYLLDQGGWEHLDLPSIAVDDRVIHLCHGKQMTRRIGDILHPERESKDTLDRIKAEIGSLMFSAQYQQRPVPVEGNLIRRDWFRSYNHLPDVCAKRIVQSWDIAMMTGDANDYSVCTTWWIIKADYYLVDVFRARLQYPDLRRKLARLAAKHRAETILIENAGPGMALLQDLWRDPPQGMPRPTGRKPEGSKVDRMVAQSAKIEAGHIHLPKEADWLDTFLHELLAFPTGRHDDQVDSVSQFLKWSASQRETMFDLTTIGMGGKVFVGGTQLR
jgi:predicted phage terminase large subunit-like protein